MTTPRDRRLAHSEDRAVSVLTAIMAIVEQCGQYTIEQLHLTRPPTHRLPSFQVILDQIHQPGDLLLAQPCHSLRLRRLPRILGDPHKSHGYPEAAVAYVSDTSQINSILNNAPG